MQIKVCGITNKEDALAACALGVNALGFILANSPRRVDISEVRKIDHFLPPFINRVAVVVNPKFSYIKEILSARLFDYIQFHGDEDSNLIKEIPIKTIKAISLRSAEDLKKTEQYVDADYFLFDSKVNNKIGGTGVPFDWHLLSQYNLGKPYILAGGLGVDNIELVLHTTRAVGVDLNSRLEKSPGIKDLTLMKATIAKIRKYQLVSMENIQYHMMGDGK